MKSTVNIFPTQAELAAMLAEEIVRRICSAANSERTYAIGLSGGSTPELLYSFLGDEYAESVPWDFVHIFWGDERCVPPGNADSNYSMARKHLIDKIDIPLQNVHRIRGEDDPRPEALRYSVEISEFLPYRDNYPVFDLLIMGLGEDGHTASIFPGQTQLFTTDELCVATTHPVTGQKRITLTGVVINNSESVVFVVTGKNKSGIVKEIIKKHSGAEQYPAYHVLPVYGSLDWYLDEDAGSLL